MKNWLCKIGIHDWESIGFQGLYYHRIGLLDEVCLRCGKKRLRLTESLKTQSDRAEKADKITGKNM